MLLQLMNDPCECVRVSVANNLNDIAKDNPQFVIDFAMTQLGKNNTLDKVLKHGCRTLLKQAHPETMKLFGFDSKGLSLTELRLESSSLRLGDDLMFTFELHNETQKEIKTRLEYAIDYQKMNGSLSRKVYKISESYLAANSSRSVTRKQHFRPITTRRYHSGLHRLTLILNGREMCSSDFQLQI